MNTNRLCALLLIALLAAAPLVADTPANLVAENIPPFPADLADKVAPYI